MTTCD